jgi:hypothetical protein
LWVVKELAEEASDIYDAADSLSTARDGARAATTVVALQRWAAKITMAELGAAVTVIATAVSHIGDIATLGKHAGSGGASGTGGGSGGGGSGGGSGGTGGIGGSGGTGGTGGSGGTGGGGSGGRGGSFRSAGIAKLEAEFMVLQREIDDALSAHPKADLLAEIAGRAQRHLKAGDEGMARAAIEQLRREANPLLTYAVHGSLRRVFDEANDVNAAPIRPSWDPPAGTRPRPPGNASMATLRAWTRERLELHVQQAIERFAGAGLTVPQLLALRKNPQLAAAFRGSRIDEFAKESVQLDPELADVLTASGFIYGPDFLSGSLPDWFDATTKKSWAQHLKDYAKKYGAQAHLLDTEPKKP